MAVHGRSRTRVWPYAGPVARALAFVSGRAAGHTDPAPEGAGTAGLAHRHVVPPDAAERLTALVEGLGERRPHGTLTLERARELPTGAVHAELGPRPR
ncbi:hypothetical protein ACFWUW_08040 [Streptomyces sp. NPDC058655]|uniref:hypothetical protein n=1 Tax=unclassified Streptomyces TaxID=2593676 RepID=UPI00365C095E